MNEYLIENIVNADTLLDSITLFRMNQNSLNNYKFIFSSNKGAIPGHTINFDFENGSAIRGLFKKERVFVLDENTVEEMLSNNCEFPIDYSISLDTQALSYLQPYIEDRKTKLPKDFEEIFNFIARDDVNVDSIAYEFENYDNLEASHQKIFDKLKAYQTLRHLDTELLQEHGLIKSTLDDEELIKCTQEHLSRLFNNLSNPELLNNLLYKYQYIHLLKMIIINFTLSKESGFVKNIKYLDFCHNRIANIGIREVLLADKYFNEGQKFLFFSKIQKNKKDKSRFFKDIQGMAWDLYHIRQMERLITIRPNLRARYYFPALLTCDKRLCEVLDLFSLKCIVFNNEESRILPFYELDIFKQLPNSEEEKRKIETYYSNNSKKDRLKRHHSSTIDLDEVIKELEEELNAVAFTS